MDIHEVVLVPNDRCVAYIQNNTSQTTVLLQLAEECNEVAHSALKLVRVYQNENPTPVTAGEASDKLHEEIADFMACLDSLVGVDYNKIERIETEKLNRWCVRLAKRGRK